MKTKTYLIVSIALLIGVSALADDVWNYEVSDDCSKNGYRAGYVSEPPADVQAVDLGLPSGLKWASCNVGATTPEEFGAHYAWGEVLPKKNYSWATYKYASGAYNKLFKYCDDAQYSNSGYIDRKTTLELGDDAAHVNWGGNWRMPTIDEWKELIENCTWTWTTQKGVTGCLVTSKTNSNSIFLPAAGDNNTQRFGIDYNNYTEYRGDFRGYYWSSSLFHNDDPYRDAGPNYAFFVYFDSNPNRTGVGGYERFRGYSVRAVCP